MGTNSQADSHDEAYRRITAENKCYFLLVQLYRSFTLSRRTKIGLYKTLVDRLYCTPKDRGRLPSQMKIN